MTKFKNTEVPTFTEEQISFLNHHIGNITLSMAYANKKENKDLVQEKIVDLIEMKKAIITQARS